MTTIHIPDLKSDPEELGKVVQTLVAKSAADVEIQREPDGTTVSFFIPKDFASYEDIGTMLSSSLRKDEEPERLKMSRALKVAILAGPLALLLLYLVAPGSEQSYFDPTAQYTLLFTLIFPLIGLGCIANVFAFVKIAQKLKGAA